MLSKVKQEIFEFPEELKFLMKKARNNDGEYKTTVSFEDIYDYPILMDPIRIKSLAKTVIEEKDGVTIAFPIFTHYSINTERKEATYCFSKKAMDLFLQKNKEEISLVNDL